jgi:glycosyltransferase involved in cell wall biosynthesis
MALISIVIITYNFEKIILECLESLETELDDIYEVIITDDGSNDKTLELCYQWREKNKDKIRIVILESKVNEGVVKNINKGCKIVKGEWIKLLAGDDILIEGSIKKIQNFINKNFEAEIIFSKVIPFYVKNEKKNYLKVLPKELDFYNKNFKKQLDELLEGNCIVAPGAIIKSELLRKMNYFDEKFKMVEDYPFWIKLLKNNIKFYFFNQEIVMYRKSENSVSGKGKSKKVNKYMLEFEIQFF